MNTNKARFLCAMTLLFTLAATAVAQEQKEDVVITTSPKKIQPEAVDNPATATGADVTIGSGVTVTIGSGVTMSLGGNFTNSGVVTAQTGSTVDFNGTDAQTLAGNTTFSNLTKSGTGQLTLNNAITVNNTLALNGGQINNSTNPINLASGASVVNGGGSTVNPPVTSGPIDVAYTNTSVIPTGSELPTSATGLNNLTINGAGVILNSSATVNGALALTSGKITLGSNNLTLVSSATISGGSSSSHVETNGTGVFTRKSVGSASAKLFPIGVGGSYNPMTITNSGTADDFSARVQTTISPAPAQPTKVVNRQWTISEAVAGGSNATLQFQWNAGDQASGFSTGSPIVIGRHDGTKWVEQSAAVSGSNPYLATATGFTSFSPFAVGNTNAIRTVVLANLKVLLEGPFNTGTTQMDNALRATVLPARFPGKPIPANAVDSVQVEIRGTATGFLDPFPTRVTRVQVADEAYESEAADKPQLNITEIALVDGAVSLNDLTKRNGGKELSALPTNPKVSQPAWLLKDGTIRNFTDTTKNYIEFDTTAGNWFVVIRHRNHLAIMTATAQALTGTTPVTAYDFTTAQTQAYGTEPMKLIGAKYCIYTGDASDDGQVTSTDFNVFHPKFRSGATGYEISDWNCDGQVTSTDFNLFSPNFRSARHTFVP
jgi:hypothetical protein